jgi:ankyrin repeat protein
MKYWDLLRRYAAEGNVEEASKLLDSGNIRDINEADEYGYTALMWAVEHGHTKVVKLLLDNGADVNSRALRRGLKKSTAFKNAVTYGHTEIVKLLLQCRNLDINAQGDTGVDTALMLAASHGHTEIVKLLLASGADINLRSESIYHNNTALMFANLHGHTEIVKLIESEAERRAAAPAPVQEGQKQIGLSMNKRLALSCVSLVVCTGGAYGVGIGVAPALMVVAMVSFVATWLLSERFAVQNVDAHLGADSLGLGGGDKVATR